MVGPGHEQQARQVVEEDVADPGGHAVSARRLEVPVDDDHGDEDRDDVHDEREQQVLGDQRDLHRGRRQDLRHQQQEHDQRQQDRYAHGHLLNTTSSQAALTSSEAVHVTWSSSHRGHVRYSEGSL